MTWIWFTLGAIFLFVFSTYVDKFLLTRYFKGREPGVLILFSSLFAVLVVPIVYLIEPASLSVHSSAALWLVIGGLMNITGVILYLYAVYADEVSVVTPLFQLIPVFNYILGFIFLDEALSRYQFLAFALILLGSILISLDLKQRRPKFKAKVFILMVIATLLLSINTVIFKAIALEQEFWPSMFWEYVALLVAGVILLLGVKKYRQEFFGVFKVNAFPIVALNVTNEVTGAVAYFLLSFASLLAPIALVSVVSGTQPAFTFIFGAAMTLLFPTLIQEDLSKKTIVQKVVAIIIIIAGGYFLERGF